MILVSALAAGCCRRDGDVSFVEWTSMGTLAKVGVRGGSLHERREVVSRVFSEVETLLSAHDPESELMRLSRSGDEEILSACSPSVRACYKAAFEMRDLTGGVFNPRWRGPETMDLGAIAKGFALDLAAAEIVRSSRDALPDILIDLGGNLKAVSGEWRIALYGSGDLFVLKPGQAVSTSGEYFRGKHIYDGRTAKACTNAVYSVTVIHPDSAMLADALSTALFVMGKEKGDAFLKRHHPEASAIWLGAQPPR